MAMLDYGAVVKLNDKILPYAKDSFGFNNYSTLNEGVLHEEYEDMIWPGDNKMHKTLVKSDYIGDESLRNFGDDEISVIHNYMSVVGDGKYLVATYKYLLNVFDSEKCLIEYYIGEDNRMVKYLGTPFGIIKIKVLSSKYSTAVASFTYRNNHYEILFGYGVDERSFIFSKHAKRYFDAKTLKKVRKWFNN